MLLKRTGLLGLLFIDLLGLLILLNCYYYDSPINILLDNILGGGVNVSLFVCLDYYQYFILFSFSILIVVSS